MCLIPLFDIVSKEAKVQVLRYLKRICRGRVVVFKVHVLFVVHHNVNIISRNWKLGNGSSSWNFLVFQLDSEEASIRMLNHACEDICGLGISFPPLLFVVVEFPKSKLLMFSNDYGNSCLSDLFREIQKQLISLQKEKSSHSH